MVLAHLTLVTLTFDPVTPKSIGQDKYVDKVWERYVKAFSSYWTETKRLQTAVQTDRLT